LLINIYFHFPRQVCNTCRFQIIYPGLWIRSLFLSIKGTSFEMIRITLIDSYHIVHKYGFFVKDTLFETGWYTDELFQIKVSLSMYLSVENQDSFFLLPFFHFILLVAVQIYFRL